MSFSADWLALREPADLAARDEDLMQQAAQLAGPNPIILDLGCGTGATARALSGLLPPHTVWRLVDGDAELLQRAAAQTGSSAETHLMDLNKIEDLPLENVTLVTASALLDLVSDPWLIAFVARLGVPFYAALTYDGTMNWTPPDPSDEKIKAAFNAHQRTDKGFGPALGPDAADRSIELLRDAGFAVESAQSPWQLGNGMEEMILELGNGIAQAAGDAGAKCATAWWDTRRESLHETSCVIGHVDLLAKPTGKS